jgi:hypothetical protein
MNRIRRQMLEMFFLLPCLLAVPGIRGISRISRISRTRAAGEYVVIDGWVMKRSDIESG